ncbi:MAG: helix-turn-helix domain-containing protein [Chitinophagaceae bacterium]|nr:helix-turn-helix domain-containing protein [Chitinophagaceae bacterium]
MTNKERFLQLVDHHDTSTIEFVKYLIENRPWLRASQSIAIKTIFRIKELGWSQKQLAEQLKVSPQYVSKLLSGQENMTLETLVKLQTLLDIPVLATYNEAKVNELQAKIKRLEKKVNSLKAKMQEQGSSKIANKKGKNAKATSRSTVV